MRILAAIVLIFYLLCTVGATFHLHYCMGEFVNWSFHDTSSEPCSKCGMTDHSDQENCCDHVQIHSKVSDAHYASYTSLGHEPGFVYDMVPFPLESSSAKLTPPETKAVHATLNSPGTLKRLYLTFRNLRI